MSDPVLFHQLIHAPGAVPEGYVLFQHGIYGQGRNWATLARQLVEAHPRLGAVLVDLRLHGRSRDFSPPHTLEAAAADLAVLAAGLEAPVRGVIGHSFGGKVALVFARDHGEALEQVWVLDSTPVPMQRSSEAAAVLQILRALPMPQPSRAAVVEALEARGLASSVAQWLATNVEGRGREFYWRLDFDGLEALLEDFYKTDLWPVVEAPPGDLELHFVKAERSNVLPLEASARIEAAGARNGRVHLHVLPDADHWLHVDNPEGLRRLLVESWRG